MILIYPSATSPSGRLSEKRTMQMNEYAIMFYLFMGLMAVVGLIKILGVFKQAGIEKKRQLYEKLLKEARTTRAKYIRHLGTSDDFRVKLEGIQSELESAKYKLNSVRTAIRKIIEDVHYRLVPSNIDKLEANVIVQKKINIGEHWKVLDNFRRQYNKKLASYKLIENESRILSKKTSESAEKWEAQKRVLMPLYDELKGVSKVDDPRKTLATATH
jgi:hypothetical protein